MPPALPGDPTQADGPDADRLRFFAGSRILLDVVPRALAPLLRQGWDTQYPTHPWQDGADCGALLVDGTRTQLEHLGGELSARQGKKVVEMDAAMLANPEIKHNAEIVIGGQEVKLIIVAGQPVRINQTFGGADGCYGVNIKRTVQVLPPMTKTGGGPVEFCSLAKLRTGLPVTGWDVTAFSIALMGSNRNVLAATDPLALHVDKVRKLKNKELSHRCGSRTDVATFNRAKKQMVDCIKACAVVTGEAETARHIQEIDDICRDTTRHLQRQNLPFARYERGSSGLGTTAVANSCSYLYTWCRSE
jgi:hypothetical protein